MTSSHPSDAELDQIESYVDGLRFPEYVPMIERVTILKVRARLYRREKKRLGAAFAKPVTVTFSRTLGSAGGWVSASFSAQARESIEGSLATFFETRGFTVSDVRIGQIVSSLGTPAFQTIDVHATLS